MDKKFIEETLRDDLDCKVYVIGGSPYTWRPVIPIGQQRNGNKSDRKRNRKDRWR